MLQARKRFLKTFWIFAFVGFANPALAQSDNEKAEKIAKIMEIFYLKPENQSPQDSVQVSGSHVTISVWRDLPKDPQPEKVECTGYQWLLTGRGEHIGKGAATVFEKMPEIQSIQLDLVEVELKTKRPYLKMVAERSAVMAANLKTEELKKDLWKNTANCLKIGRSVISKREIQL